jgi:hypothetical protein
LLSHQRKRGKKKESRQFCEWLSEVAAHLPAAVSLLLLEALFMQISGVSLALTWPRRLCLLRVLLGATATATSFPLSKHTGGGDTAPAFSGWFIYLQFMWEVGLPPLLWSFPPIATFTSFPTLGCWVCAAAPVFSSPLVYLQFHGGLPSPLFGTQGTPPSLLCVFFVVVYYSVSLFSLGGGRSDQGAMLIWPRIVCGNTVCHLAHLVVCIFPSGLGAGVWQRGSPPGFSV